MNPLSNSSSAVASSGAFSLWLESKVNSKPFLMLGSLFLPSTTPGRLLICWFCVYIIGARPAPGRYESHGRSLPFTLSCLCSSFFLFKPSFSKKSYNMVWLLIPPPSCLCEDTSISLLLYSQREETILLYKRMFLCRGQ